MLTDQLILKVYELEFRRKESTVFEWFDSLDPGASFIIKNDHDPRALYYQMLSVLGSVFTWEYMEKGPEYWQVLIRKNINGELTVGEIAAKDIRKAEAMWKIGIDFCCSGNKTVSQAATAVGITVADFHHELEVAENNVSMINTVDHAYNDWDADFLSDYILNRHHNYFYDNRDRILQLAKKVRQSHGEEYPELIPVYHLMEKLTDELNIHFYIEENLLFPYIKELVVFKKHGIRPRSSVSMSKGSLCMMHSEHEYAGDILKKMRNITGGYQVPDGACYSVRSLYAMLQDLDSDLCQHIHLENNILFPKAIRLEKELY